MKNNNKTKRRLQTNGPLHSGLLAAGTETQGATDVLGSVGSLQLVDDLGDLLVGESLADGGILREKDADGLRELLQLLDGGVRVVSDEALQDAEELHAQGAGVLTFGFQDQGLILEVVGTEANLLADLSGILVILDIIDDVRQSVINNLVANLRESGNERADLIQIVGNLLFSVIAFNPILDQSNDLNTNVAVGIGGLGGLSKRSGQLLGRGTEIELRAQGRGILILLNPFDHFLHTIINQGIARLLPRVWSQGADDFKVLFDVSNGRVVLNPVLYERDDLLTNSTILSHHWGRE